MAQSARRLFKYKYIISIILRAGEMQRKYEVFYDEGLENILNSSN